MLGRSCAQRNEYERDCGTADGAGDRWVRIVGGWMKVELLQRGFQVRTTLRDLNRAEEVRAAVNEQVSSGNRLSFVAADLRRDEGWC